MHGSQVSSVEQGSCLPGSICFLLFLLFCNTTKFDPPHPPDIGHESCQSSMIVNYEMNILRAPFSLGIFSLGVKITVKSKHLRKQNIVLFCFFALFCPDFKCHPFHFDSWHNTKLIFQIIRFSLFLFPISVKLVPVRL